MDDVSGRIFSGLSAELFCFSAASLIFLVSRFFLFFSAAFDKDSSISSLLLFDYLSPVSTASAPGTNILRGLPKQFPEDEVLLATKAMPPSSSLLKASGVDWPRAPGGRYAPADLEGVLT